MAGCSVRGWGLWVPSSRPLPSSWLCLELVTSTRWTAGKTLEARACHATHSLKGVGRGVEDPWQISGMTVGKHTTG